MDYRIIEEAHVFSELENYKYCISIVDWKDKGIKLEVRRWYRENATAPLKPQKGIGLKLKEAEVLYKELPGLIAKMKEKENEKHGK